MNEPIQQQEVKRHEVQEVLRELVRWSDSRDRYGHYCKVCGGEGSMSSMTKVPRSGCPLRP
jgi:hypothetical protein